MTRTIIRNAVILPLAALLVVSACSSPTIVDDDHFDVEGFSLFEGDTQLYRYMLDDGTPPPLTLEQRTHEVTFVPLNSDGEPLPEDEEEHEDDEHELRITIDDISILSWAPEEHGDDDAFIVFHGELIALQAGTTTMNVCVPHEGHCDFEADIQVTVTDQ